ncbi:PREDICTED: uncharacterized protein LOC105620582 [Atta cephalotes]|uniref:DDE Tnp4 domain-containing protein n=1 Tax=Atta cephalotes TaxID=12957 RepID=A0A158NIV4_ATTCE|nr:PREDICTED: uncharacterized protein LOC105620582 [Atta cephalotes]
MMRLCISFRYFKLGFPNGFPNIIGTINGCHIPCKQPVENDNDYYNRKEFHSIILQVGNNIGDTAYPLMCNLMTPFEDNGYLTRSQTLYNINSIQFIIEAVFGLLKAMIRRLKYLDVSDFELTNKMIAAACVLHNCVLHNFIIIGDRMFPEDENYEIDDEMWKNSKMIL